MSRVTADSQLITGDRLNAANRFDLAKEFPDPERKLALLDMAAAWLDLNLRPLVPNEMRG